MIFLTVGSQMPFDRLVRAVDDWAVRNRAVHVFAQVGETDYAPASMEWVKVLPPDAYLKRVAECRLLIGHAGMGTVITAADYAKPLLVMPRRGDLRETRNDHQVATARWLQERPGIRVAMNPSEIGASIDRSLADDIPIPATNAASDELIATLRCFIEEMP